MGLLILSLNGVSQPNTTTDTIVRLKSNVARNMYKDALQKPILEERISILNERITNLQILVKTVEQKDSILIMDSQNQIKLLLEEMTLCQDQVKTMETIIRKERRKRFWVSAAGIVTTGAAIYLSTLK